jgi:hypothetical protein
MDGKLESPPSTETGPLEGKWAALLTGEVVFKSGEHLLLNVYLWVGLVGLGWLGGASRLPDVAVTFHITV